MWETENSIIDMLEQQISMLTESDIDMLSQRIPDYSAGDTPEQRDNAYE